jgi:hypothetical protein
MRFLAPGFLHLAWLLVIPVALYLYRRQARRVQVSTLLFFRVLAREHQESAALRRLKRWLSLLLTLLIFLALMVALARPVWSGVEEGAALVLVLDRSASMAAKDASGVTRLEAGVKEVRGRLSGVPESVEVSVIAADARGEVMLARSRNRREVLRVLNALETRPVEGNAEAVWRVARRMQGLVAGSQVWWVSDENRSPKPENRNPKPEAENRGLNLEGDAMEEAEVVWVDVGLSEAVNVGVTAFQVRAMPLERERLEGFLQVSAAAGNPGSVTAKVEVTVGGRLAHLREVELAAGKSLSLSLPLEGGRGQVVEARVTTAGDCLSWDDGAVARLPAVKPLRVAWYAAAAVDPFTELAFQSLVDAGRVEMVRGDVSAFPPVDAPDVYVFENWLPTEWPEGRPVIALRPPRSLGPLTVKALPGGGVPHSGVRVVRAEHPVLHRVVVTRVAVTQSSVLEVSRGLEALWMAGDEVLLAAGEVLGQRLVVGAFTPARSEQLTRLPAFPLLLGNALFWCAEDPALQRGLEVTRTGEMLEGLGRTDWVWWDGEAFQVGAQTLSGWTEAQRVGAWVAEDGRSGMTLLASAKETDVPVRAEAKPVVTEGGLPSVTQVSAGPGWTVVKWLLLGLLGLLLAESYLFHRRAVY